MSASTVAHSLELFASADPTCDAKSVFAQRCSVADVRDIHWRILPDVLSLKVCQFFLDSPPSLAGRWLRRRMPCSLCCREVLTVGGTAHVAHIAGQADCSNKPKEFTDYKYL